MPRDIPVGNGRLLVTFDHLYQIRDAYFPHVGQENHCGAGPCRFGVHTETPAGKRELHWTSNGKWTIRQRYLRDTLTTSVSLEHPTLKLSLYCNDVVDFHRPIFVRKIKIKNGLDRARLIKVFHHHDFNMLGSNIGDTAYFDPELNSLVHYRGKRYIMVTFFCPPAPSPLGGEGWGEGTARHLTNGAGSPSDVATKIPGQTPHSVNPHFTPHPNPLPSRGEGARGGVWTQRIDEFATGTRFAGAEGTWRDAEDGVLGGNAIAQGAVDSTIAHHAHVDADGESTAYMVIIAGESRDELIELHKWMQKMTPQGVIDRTTSYWRLWVGGTNINFGNLPTKVVDMFKRSLLVTRTNIDNNGAICAANDSDIMQFSRDTYSYVWPRDGALVADSLDLAGFPDLARSFYTFCQKTITDGGYFYHKYNPDMSPASSWHPWVIKGKQAMPIQEDETALVVWALWRHYYRYRDIEFIRPLWVDIVQKAADFMCDYRDPRTGLPHPSYDLWEERWGVHAFTVATVYGGLKAARNFAVCFGDRERADKYNKAAEEVKAGAAKYLWSDHLNRFVRRLVPRDNPVPPANANYVEQCELKPDEEMDHYYEVDEVLDSSLYSIYKFHLFDVDDPRVVATMQAVEQRLWVKTKVGGVARYENDYYHRVSDNIKDIPGNPWFICTLWLADYFISRAKNANDLKAALPILEWCANHALESGVLAEQVHPLTNAPLSVSPLTWSHATVVSTTIKYLEKLESLQLCNSCHQPVFRMQRTGAVEVKSQATFSKNSADFERNISRETAAATGKLFRDDPKTHQPVSATLSIDARDCIGCEVCVATCTQDVLKMVDGKALIDLRNLNKCDLDGQCVDVCPTKVVSLTILPHRATEAA